MEQLPDQHSGGPGKPQAGRGLRGCDPGLRGQEYQGAQSGALRLQPVLQTCIQGNIELMQ